ncbi:MAG: hypothetical protein KKB51_24725 [Candidatus Riflebacteria bacterium]|nr:hypothetical protein [Candidatus Riflebacteria bacterium]
MVEKKIRMATSEGPDEQGHTIVGGRPQAPRNMRNDIPRGLEILVKRASIDSKFKAELLEKREKIADELQIPLDVSEKAMLAGVPADHLEKMIKATEVPPAQRSILSKGTAAAMLALLAQLTFAPVPGRAEVPPKLPSKSDSLQADYKRLPAPGGIRPDLEEDDHLADRGARPDLPSPNKPKLYDEQQPTRGIRPDIPTLIDVEDEQPYTDEDLDGIDSAEPSAPEFAKVVNFSVAGKKLSEVIKMLQENTGIAIQTSGIDERLADYLVESDVDGLPLKMAIETICLETSSEACEFEILWKNEPPSVEINFHDNLDTATPPVSVDTFHHPSDRDDNSSIVKGIRPDVPTLKKMPHDFAPGDNK